MFLKRNVKRKTYNVKRTIETGKRFLACGLLKRTASHAFLYVCVYFSLFAKVIFKKTNHNQKKMKKKKLNTPSPLRSIILVVPMKRLC